MTTEAYDQMVLHVKSLQQAILDLQKFGIETGSTAPSHYGFLVSHTNATISLLAICAARSGVAKVEFPEPLNPQQWASLIIMVHRSYLAGLITAVEAICSGYCETKTRTVSPSRSGRAPEFLDYVNSALNASRLSEDRRTFWRKCFDGMRILRNKCSHFDTSLAEHEKTALHDAGLASHIGGDGRVQTQWSDYSSLAQKVLSFSQELETTSAG
jgi:hypothetical protein